MASVMTNMAIQTGDNTIQLGRQGEDFNTLPVLLQQDLIMWDCRRKTFTRGLSGGFIVGHPEFSLVGSATVGNNNAAFIIEHPTFGTLGSYFLDTNAFVYELQYVQNAHNLFIEGFWNNRFFDTGSSTGSWMTGSEWYYVAVGSSFYSDYIAKEDKSYKAININITSEREDDGTTGTSLLEATAILGGDAYNLTVNDTTVIPNTGSEGLKIRITNTGTVGEGDAEEFGSAGLSFPINLGTGSFINTALFIKEFTVQYSE